MSIIKKIPISALKPGMFILELDISWLKSPFLRHHRRVENQNDILLLKHAGVRLVSIDLEKSFDILSKTDKSTTSDNLNKKIAIDEQQNNSALSPAKDSSTAVVVQTTPLSEELKTAKVIQGKIHKLVNKLNENVKSGNPISVKGILPIINESLDSIKRNDQALLTKLHLHRKDKRLDAHAFATFSLILTLALKIGCTKKQIEILGMTALLHDCGWSKLPINLFGKGKKYTPGEKLLVKQHTKLASQALRKSKGIDENIIQLIEQHHEISNGKGYPRQLQAEQLHSLHNLLQVVDLYDEHLHGLEDSPAILAVNALKNLYQKSTIGWFPQSLVSEMIRILGIYPINSVVKLTSGEIAIVTEINRKLTLLPRVKLTHDSEQQIFEKPILLDLAEDKQHRLIINVLEPSIFS
ncbi:MAG: DUF3391 domain-containing protein [Pseudomonadota bacterium]